MKALKIRVRAYCFVHLFIFFFSANAQMLVTDIEIDNQKNKHEYLYALGEATKLFLLGSYPQAVNLYKECLKINPSSSASHFQLAKILLQAGEVISATEHAKKACTISPENNWYLQELAQTYQIRQELDSAIIVYEDIIRQDPENASIAFIMASLFERLGKYNNALSYLDRIEKSRGLSKETAIARSRILEDMGLYSAALSQLQIALKLSENEYSIIGMIAEFYRNNGSTDSARYYYAKIYPAFRNDPVVVFSYSEFLLEQKQIDSAIEVMITAIRNDTLDQMAKTGYLYKVIQEEKLFRLNKQILDTVVSCYYRKYSNDGRATAIFADIELRLGNYRKSSEALKRIIFYDKRNYPAYEQLLFCENSLGNHDSVAVYSREAILNFPNMPVPYLFSGSAGYQRKEFNEAISDLEKGLILSKNEKLTLEFYSLLAECYARIEAFERSDDFFKKALSIDQKNSGVANNFAYYLALRKKDLEYARKLSRETLEKEPMNSTYLDTYGWILYNMNKIKRAKKYIQMAVQSGGEKNSEILLHYGEILIRLERYKESQIFLRKALIFAESEEEGKINELLKQAEVGRKP